MKRISNIEDMKKDAESFGAETWDRALNGTYRTPIHISADSGEIEPDGARLIATVYFEATKDTKHVIHWHKHIEANQLIDDNPPADYDAEMVHVKRPHAYVRKEVAERPMDRGWETPNWHTAQNMRGKIWDDSRCEKYGL